jgi:hypothetical protein
MVATFKKYFCEDFDRTKHMLPLTTKEKGFESEKQNALNVARLISLEGYRRLFEEVAPRSTIGNRVDHNSSEISTLNLEAKRLK